MRFRDLGRVLKSFELLSVSIFELLSVRYSGLSNDCDPDRPNLLKEQDPSSGRFLERSMICDKETSFMATGDSKPGPERYQKPKSPKD